MQRHSYCVIIVFVSGLLTAFATGEARDILANGSPVAAELSGRYFPGGILHASWQEFAVQGYKHPITGVVYRGNPRPTCGMPLGGLDTGCIDIEPNGLLG